jgi:hypothetical protein
MHFLSMTGGSERMHVRREDMHICVSSPLKCKMHLHLRDSIGG